MRTSSYSKLVRRLGLKKYDVECPLDDTLVKATTVKLMLSQHIGAPASACVATGDKVTEGQVVANAPEGLGVAIHASITGKVTEVTAEKGEDILKQDERSVQTGSAFSSVFSEFSIVLSEC